MRGMRSRLRAVVGLTVVFALCFTLAGVQPAYAGNIGLDEALDTPLTIYNQSWDGWMSTDAHDGVDMVQSPPLLGPLGSSFFEIHVAGPATITWWSKTSSEANWDYLKLFDNTVEQTGYRQSGITNWAQWSYDVSAGDHVIRWVYAKDGTINIGADCAYVDQLTYTPEPPVGRVDGAHLARNEVALLHGSPAASDQFGSAVAIGLNVLAVGAPWDDTGFADAGSVTIFRRVNGTWVTSQVLTAVDEAASAHFGGSVSLSHGRLAVGAGDKIYVYLDNGTGFTPYGSPITCPDGNGYAFGQTFDIDGNMLVAAAKSFNGQRGRVYHFRYSSGAWNSVEHLDAPDAALNDFFGTSVALEDDRLVVGAPDHDHPGAPGGAVYIFDIDSGTFSFTAEYTDPNAIADDKLGCSVGLSGNTIVAGSSNPNVITETPRVVVWVANELTDVITSGAALDDTSWYGLRVAIDGDTILVPDEWYGGHPHGGSVLAYQRSNGRFFDLAETIQMAADQSFAGFGRSASISGAQFAVGAGVWDGAAGSAQGSAYVYDGAYYRVPEGATLNVASEKGITANDISPMGVSVHPAGYASPAHGTMTLYAMGSFDYTAASPSPAEVPFTYNLTDDISPAVGPIDAYITVAPKPTGTPVINHGSHGSPLSEIPVDLTPLGNVRMFRTRVGTASWGSWMRFAPATTVNLLSAGTSSVQVEVSGPGGNAVHSWDVTYPSTYARFPGSDRYNTAIMAAQSAYPAGSCTSVIIATGNNYPDALAAAGLGGAADAPVLLVNPAKTRADVIAEIKRLTQGKASFKLYIMGGTSAVPTATETWLKSSLTGENVKRFAGTDRYHTARLVAAEMKTLLGGSFGTTALLIPGMDFTDGLIVGPAAYSAKAPILLTRPQSDWELAGTLQQLGITRLVLCGSTTALPAASAETYLKSVVPGLSTVRATSSADPYVRSAEAAEYFATPANGFGLTWDGVGIATAERYPDGLAAGCIEGKAKAPLLLTKVASLPATIGTKLTAHKGTIATVRFYGGDMAISPAAETAVRNALK